MNTDIRIQVGLWQHPKWLRLGARLGPQGQLALIRLWCWVGQYRDDGRLYDVADDEIEIVAAGWTGESGKFLEAILALRWADRDDEGVVVMHDWAEHNPWCAARTARADAARTAALVKAHKQRGENLPPAIEKKLSEKALIRFYGKRIGSRKYREHQASARDDAQRSAGRTCGSERSASAPYLTDPDPPPTGREGEEGSPGTGFGRASGEGPPCPPGFTREQWQRRCDGKPPKGIRGGWDAFDRDQARAAQTSVQQFRRDNGLDPESGFIASAYWQPEAN